MPETGEPGLYTRDEIQASFLKHIAGLIDYWSVVQPWNCGRRSPGGPTHHAATRLRNILMGVAATLAGWAGVRLEEMSRLRLEGLAHSIFVLLDGNATALPGFVVAPAPHPSDREYCIENGENFFPEAPEGACDIAGELHERMYAFISRTAQH